MGATASTPAVSTLSNRLISASASERLSAAVTLRAVLNERAVRAPAASAASARRVFGPAVLAHARPLIRRLVRAAAWTLTEPRAVDAALAALDALAALATLFHAAQDHGVPHDTLYNLANPLRKRALPLLVMRLLHQDMRVSAAASTALVALCDVHVVKSAAWMPTARAALAFRNQQPSEVTLKALLVSLSTLVHCVVYQAVTTPVQTPIGHTNSHDSRRRPAHVALQPLPINRRQQQTESLPTSPLSSASPSRSRSNSLSHSNPNSHSSSTPTSAAPSPLRAQRTTDHINSASHMIPQSSYPSDHPHLDTDPVTPIHIPLWETDEVGRDEYDGIVDDEDDIPRQNFMRASHLHGQCVPLPGASSQSQPATQPEYVPKDRPEVLPAVPRHRHALLLGVQRRLSAANIRTGRKLDYEKKNDSTNVARDDCQNLTLDAEPVSLSSPVSVRTAGSSPGGNLRILDDKCKSKHRFDSLQNDRNAPDLISSSRTVGEPRSSPLLLANHKTNEKSLLKHSALRHSYPASRHSQNGDASDDGVRPPRNDQDFVLSRRQHRLQRQQPNSIKTKSSRIYLAWSDRYPAARPYLWRDMRAAMSCLTTLLTHSTNPPTAKQHVASELVAILVNAKSGHRARAAGIDHVAYCETAMVAFLDYSPTLYDVILRTLFCESTVDAAVVTNAACDPQTAATCMSLLAALLEYAPDSCIPRPPLLTGLANRAHYIADKVFSVVKSSNHDHISSALPAGMAQDCNERLTSVVSSLKCLKAACPPLCSDVQIEHAAGVALRSVCAAGGLVASRAVRSDLPLASDSAVLEAMRSFKQLSSVSPRGLLWARGPVYCAVVTMLAAFACRVSLVNILRALIDIETGTGVGDIFAGNRVIEIEVPQAASLEPQENVLEPSKHSHVVTYEASSPKLDPTYEAVAYVHRDFRKNTLVPGIPSERDVALGPVSSPRLHRSSSRKRQHIMPRTPPAIIPSAGTFYNAKGPDVVVPGTSFTNVTVDDSAFSAHDTASVTYDSYTSNDEDEGDSDAVEIGKKDPLEIFERDSSSHFGGPSSSPASTRNRHTRTLEPRVISCGLEIQDDNPLEDMFCECVTVLARQCGGRQVAHDLLRSVLREYASDSRVTKPCSSMSTVAAPNNAPNSGTHVGPCKVNHLSQNGRGTGAVSNTESGASGKLRNRPHPLDGNGSNPMVSDDISRQLLMITDASPGVIGSWFCGRCAPARNSSGLENLPHGKVFVDHDVSVIRNISDSQRLLSSRLDDQVRSPRANPVASRESNEVAIEPDAYEEMIGTFAVLLRALKFALPRDGQADISDLETSRDTINFSTLSSLIGADIEASQSPLLIGVFTEAMEIVSGGEAVQHSIFSPAMSTLNNGDSADRDASSKLLSRTTVCKLFAEIASLKEEVATMREMLDTTNRLPDVVAEPPTGSGRKYFGRRHSSSSLESPTSEYKKSDTKLLSRRRVSLFCGVPRTFRLSHHD